MENFKQECDEWLNPLGYYIHNHNPGYSVITYTHKDTEMLYPAITCNNVKELGQFCSLRSSIKLFCTIESGNLQFKHPDIKRWINYMTKCEVTCNSLSL